MFSQMMPLLPPQASTLAEKVDDLFWFIVVITTAATLGVFAVLVLFSWRFRRKEGEKVQTPRILGSHRLELFWTVTPLIIFLIMFVWGAVVYNEAVHPPEDAPEIFFVGKQWMWKIQYPGGQRVIVGANPSTFTERDWKDVGVLVLPVNRPVKVTGTSEDVIHSIGVPAFRMKMDVLPGRYTSTWWHPTLVGEYHLFCDQYCGTQHSQMVGKVRVVEQAEYDRWLGESVEGSLAMEGRKLFLKLQCLGCHSNNAEARAPVLEALYRKRVPLKGGGTALADEHYIRESILKPRAKVVEGWEAIMPAYQGQVTEEDLIKVIAYIRSLKPGDLKDANVAPVRTEHFPPPVGAPTQPSEGGSPK